MIINKFLGYVEVDVAITRLPKPLKGCYF